MLISQGHEKRGGYDLSEKRIIIITLLQLSREYFRECIYIHITIAPIIRRRTTDRFSCFPFRGFSTQRTYMITHLINATRVPCPLGSRKLFVKRGIACPISDPPTPLRAV